MKTVSIPEDVKDVLSDATLEDGILKLPEGQLDRKLYQSVAKVLQALGGKWNRGKAGFVFAKGAPEDLTAILEAGEVVDKKKTWEQFYTPRDLAAEVVSMAGIEENQSVLEPSAGDGALIREIVKYDPVRVDAVEIDPENVRTLTEQGLCNVISCVDFLKFHTPRRWDRIVMNPPFSGNKDIKHVEHAYEMLAPGGTLVSIMSTHWTFAGDKASVRFREFVMDDHNYVLMEPGKFKASGTDVPVSVVILTKP